MQSPKLIFSLTRYSQRLAINDSLLYPKKDAYDWTPQRGYLDDENDDNVIPRRSSGPGLKKGLTLILDAHLDNYYCSSAGSAGFKIHQELESMRIC
ncbi:unnamed protein product [Callosobruchus maculatus]|uniref:Uncharacterized protein n=1 Tax=Callosobruchus maculatus TaxID=64391 RepID=A0A653BFU9_CALMS|nr:unnamed protein product [Callosobruchus maculatus]